MRAIEATTRQGQSRQTRRRRAHRDPKKLHGVVTRLRELAAQLQDLEDLAVPLREERDKLIFQGSKVGGTERELAEAGSVSRQWAHRCIRDKGKPGSGTSSG